MVCQTKHDEYHMQYQRASKWYVHLFLRHEQVDSYESLSEHSRLIYDLAGGLLSPNQYFKMTTTVPFPDTKTQQYPLR